MNVPWKFSTIRFRALLRPGSNVLDRSALVTNVYHSWPFFINVCERSMSSLDRLWPLKGQKSSETVKNVGRSKTFAKSRSCSRFKNERITTLFLKIRLKFFATSTFFDVLIKLNNLPNPNVHFQKLQRKTLFFRSAVLSGTKNSLDFKTVLDWVPVFTLDISRSFFI